MQGSPFAYYQLINTINPVVTGQTGSPFRPINDHAKLVNTNNLVNTSMET